MSDALLQDIVGWQPDRILEAFGLQELVDLWIREGGVGAEVASYLPGPVTCDRGLKHILPTVRRMDIARTQHTAFQIAKLVEDEQRVITGAVTGVGFPCAIDTSIWRSSVTICSALNLFFGMTQAPFQAHSLTTLGSKKPGQVTQQPDRMRRIGVLMAHAESDREG
jgi:hypothetical protein